MKNSVFAEQSFWLMVAVSIFLPLGIYGVLMVKRAVSRWTVLLLGIVFVVIAGVDVYFLGRMATVAATSASVMDDAVFLSEVSFALYLFPLMFGGIGVNMVSHVLMNHLTAAESRFAKEHSSKREPYP